MPPVKTSVTELPDSRVRVEAEVPAEEVERRVLAMPKAEIHVHLEGATDAETVWRMAARNGVRLPALTLHGWRDFYRYRNFDHFLEVYATACTTMRAPEDWSLMVESFLVNQTRQNVRYCEAFISVSHLAGDVPHAELLHALQEGATAGRARHGVRVTFIADVARQVSEGDKRIIGVMIESHLVAGRQDVVLGVALTYGQSITDGCIDWETTVPALELLADDVAARRQAKRGKIREASA